MSPLARGAAALALAGAVACGSDPVASAALSPEEAAQLVDAVDAVRAGASPTPVPPLPPLTWSAQLAATAAGAAQGCTLPSAGATPAGEAFLAAASALSPAEAVQRWAAEGAYYDQPSASCRLDGNPYLSCGDYVQLVTRATTAVGCAHGWCSEDNPFGVEAQWQLWVCLFDAPAAPGAPPY